MKPETSLETGSSTLPTLFVADVEQMVRFYVDTLGFDVLRSPLVTLTFDQRPVLILTAASATAKPPYSLMIQLPDRRQLAKVVGRLCTMKYPNTRVDTRARQFVKLNDPEGNLVEFGFANSNQLSQTEQPLDIEKLFNELLPDDRLCDKIPATATLTIAAK